MNVFLCCSAPLLDLDDQMFWILTYLDGGNKEYSVPKLRNVIQDPQHSAKMFNSWIIANSFPLMPTFPLVYTHKVMQIVL